MKLDIVVFGLSITSSWGNGHATTYRALIKALAERGHKVTFLERDVPWYRKHRDFRTLPHCRVELYRELKDVAQRYTRVVADADLVILGSYVPDGAILADWITSHAAGVTAFYDIDTPVTLAGLENGTVTYITAAMIPRFDLYLSFTGGPVLSAIEQQYGSPRAYPLYCAVDPAVHVPVEVPVKWTLGYLGTYSDDRQPALKRLLIDPARRLPHARFVVAGPQYPADIRWPKNVERIEHLSASGHSRFYAAQQFTLNVTRADMVSAGFSPSVRLFEAAACGVPIISDRWAGIETFLAPGQEILIAETSATVIEMLRDLPDERRRAIAAAARKRVLGAHTAAHRAKQLEEYYAAVTAEAAKQVEAVA